MKRSALVLASYLALVFVSGLVVGALGYRLYTADSVAARSQRPSPEEYRRRYVETLTSRLKLTGEQVGKLNLILDETRDRFRTLDEDIIRPHKQEIRDHQVEAINTMLTEEQRAGYEKFRQERAERRRQREQKGGGPPPHQHP